MQKNAIAFFNFDHTITRIDSFKGFIRFSMNKKRRFWKFFLLLPTLFLQKVRLLPLSRAKERVFEAFFAGMEAERFKKLAHDYSLKFLPSKIKREAEKKILWHVGKHHEVVVVSSALEEWITPWAKTRGAKVIATQVEVVDGKLTGKFLGERCAGEEKVNRIKAQYDLERFAYLFAYGNAKKDKEMIALAHEKHYDEFI